MPKITEMYAFVMQDGKDPKDEGIMGLYIEARKTFFPLVGADMSRVSSLIPEADKISEQVGRPYKILRFQLISEITRRSKPEIGGIDETSKSDPNKTHNG